ncbi:PH domain-containing protein [Micromonospora sp. NPDC048170]|uniref:PH domain-containing protein n=1 Tax=Micromonospora sp. NPDC048170 TaxID=3154819 RepID=UPI0033FAA64B
MRPDVHGVERGYDMELHRNRGALVLPLACVIGGGVLLALPGENALLRRLVALGAVLLGGGVLVGLLRPFRFVIDADGLTVRRPGLRRTIPWAQVAALALARPPARQGLVSTPRLLLVPAPGALADLPADARHPVDGRAAVELLDLARIREEPAEVATALTRHAGDRFVDALDAGPADDRPGDRHRTP